MDLYQLETFLAVADEGGFSRAAAKLHRTQPAISQTIRKLEADTGEILFERTARDGSLTAAGEVLHEYARRLLSLRAEASSAIEELRSLERGRLQLAANEYTSLYLLPVLDEFRRLCPQIGVTVQRSLASRIPDEVLHRTVEMGIVSFRPETEEFQSITVYADDVAFVVSPRHPLAREKRVSIRSLGAENFVAHNVPSPLRRQVIEAFQKHKTPLNMGVELPSLEAIKRFVAMGNGVALVPGLTVQPEVEAGRLVKVPVPELEFDRRLRLVHRRHATLSHAAQAFLKVVRKLAAERGRPFLYSAEPGAAGASTRPARKR
jgi:DNA-binding transcriptional LysR family regulator